MPHLMANKGCMELGGYLYNNDVPHHISTFRFADDNDAHAYVGYDSTSKTHRYVIATHDAHDDYVVHQLNVWLGPKGRMVAEFGGVLFSHPEQAPTLAFIRSQRYQEG